MPPRRKVKSHAHTAAERSREERELGMRPELGRRKKKGATTGGHEPHYTVEDLLAQAEEASENADPEAALRHLERAMRMAPDDVRVVEAVGELYMGVGMADEARAMFERAVALSPEDGAQKYLNLGQLAGGTDAVALFEKGIALLRASLDGLLAPLRDSAPTPASPTAWWHIVEHADADVQLRAATTARQISTALCSIGDLFMTDLCDGEDAETQCSRAFEEACAIEPTNVDAFHGLANCRLCQQAPDEAQAPLSRAVELIHAAEERARRGITADIAAAEATAAGGVRGAATEASGGGGGGDARRPLPVLEAEERVALLLPPPSLGIRLSTARVAIEIGRYADAAALLDALIEEDDNCWEAWFRLATTLASTRDNAGVADLVVAVHGCLRDRLREVAGDAALNGERIPDAAFRLPTLPGLEEPDDGEEDRTRSGARGGGGGAGGGGRGGAMAPETLDEWLGQVRGLATAEGLFAGEVRELWTVAFQMRKLLQSVQEGTFEPPAGFGDPLPPRPKRDGDEGGEEEEGGGGEDGDDTRGAEDD